MSTIADVKSPWGEISDDLDTRYSEQPFLKNKYRAANPFKVLFPPATAPDSQGVQHDVRNTFFGTKVLNIFIIQQPYGFDEHDNFAWDNSESAFSVAVQGAIDLWNGVQARRFPYYKTLVYADFWSLTKLPSPDDFLHHYISQFRTTVTKFKEVIPSITGFEYGSDLTTAVEANYFQQVITDFYGRPAYKL